MEVENGGVGGTTAVFFLIVPREPRREIFISCTKSSSLFYTIPLANPEINVKSWIVLNNDDFSSKSLRQNLKIIRYGGTMN